jgi:hypothetical protein
LIDSNTTRLFRFVGIPYSEAVLLDSHLADLVFRARRRNDGIEIGNVQQQEKAATGAG